MPGRIRVRTVQGYFLKEDLERLKEKTGASNKQEAIAVAVEHYLVCRYLED